MTILHVTDFHFNKSWFEWLLRGAPPHDLLAMSGDLLDHASATPFRRQVAWVTDWILDQPGNLCICSGNHDLEWDGEAERWRPARWLREVASERVSTDGRPLRLGGLSILPLGCAVYPDTVSAAAADIWVVHAPPAGTLVSSRVSGGDAGDPDLVAAVNQHRPRVVLAGHVHDPVCWQQRDDSTLYLNPGYIPDRPFPNHILLETPRMTSKLVTADGVPSVSPDPAGAQILTSVTAR